MRLNATEIECVKRLAKALGEGKQHWSYDNAIGWEEIGLTKENFLPVLKTLEHEGIITNVTHTSATWFDYFVISPFSIQVAREIESLEQKKEEPKDVVEEIRKMARKNKWIAYLIVGSGVLVIVVTGINQLLSLIKNIREL